MAKSNDASTERDEWVRRVSDLMDEIQRWAESRQWMVLRSEKQITEESLGTYLVPVLRIQPAGSQDEIRVEPVASRTIGGRGRIDILSWPTLNRMRIIGIDRDWVLYTDSNLRWPMEWSGETFADVVSRLLAA